MDNYDSICNCDFNSQIANVASSPDWKYCKITITDYLNNKELQEKFKLDKAILVCDKDEDLIKCDSDKIKPYFKHKNKTHDNGMTEWHKNWQSKFDDTEIPVGNRIADAKVGNIILEFQHSRIPKENIDERTQNYLDHNMNPLWIIDCNNSISISNEGENNLLIEFKPNSVWKYDNFINPNLEYIYLNYEDKIFKINPNNVKKQIIIVNEYKLEDDFIQCIKNNILNWELNDILMGTIYHNQRGAGCGKTYESIQLLEKNVLFKHKTTFIYLTKLHTAKEVIYQELDAQKEILTNLQFENPKGSDEEKFGNFYKIKYHNKETKKDIEIIIGTIDSFKYAIGDKTVRDSDYFKGIVRSINDGYVGVDKNGSIRYAQCNKKLNPKCLIIVDEAQDLDYLYVTSFFEIIKETGIDVYIIGDKLQSIYDTSEFEYNIHTFLENKQAVNTVLTSKNLNINIIRSEGKNHVMRFHNIHFKSFVNEIIDFKKYGLPEIDNICNAKCNYVHEDDIIPYNIFKTPKIYATDCDEPKMSAVINNILEYMNNEIIKYNYLPKNFMFIFPILSTNYLANRLEAKLQDFWIDKFNNIEYQKNIMKNKNNDFWKNKLGNLEYYKYVYLHKSNDGRAINLKESENASRILSIHSSKGSGCEVVFLLGLTEASLNKFSNTGTLVYDSLIHVAITRQKKSLYVGLEHNNDDIFNKFKKFNDCDAICEPYISIGTMNKYPQIIDHFMKDKNIYREIDNLIIQPNNFENMLPKNEIDEKKIVDWGHHIIRNSVFLYNIMSNIMENEQMCDDDMYKSQFYTILNNISKLGILRLRHNEYYKKLQSIDRSNKSRPIKQINEIPILIFSAPNASKYFKFADILTEIIGHIQQKIQKCNINKTIPKLCPLESVILNHMIEIYQNGSFSEISIMDIYSIIYCYAECFTTLMKHPYDCLCNKYLVTQAKNNILSAYEDITRSITTHYDKLIQINEMYVNYKNYIINNYGNTLKFEYNINHFINFYNTSKNFRISNKYPIIAYSDKIVIHFIISPQFNKLNFNEIIFEAIFNNHILDYCSNENNAAKFNNKKHIACIFTLDSNMPIFYECDINSCDINIFKLTREYLTVKYSKYNEIIFDFYEYCCKNKPDNIDSVTYIINKFDKIDSESRNKIPEYVKIYFNCIKKEIEKVKSKNTNKKIISKMINEILEKVKSKSKFLEDISYDLNNAINEFINHDILNENNNENNNEDNNY